MTDSVTKIHTSVCFVYMLLIINPHFSISPVVHRQALAHRLARLEKRLKVPKTERHECAGTLQKAAEVKFIGERIKRRKEGMPYDKTNAFANKVHVPVSVQIQGGAAVAKHLEQLKVCTLHEVT